jgi:hypothetical protein
MTAEDLVIYNGVSMRRDYAESLESAQHTAFYRVGGRDIARLRFGKETYPMVTPGDGLCECCSAARGQFHEPLCEREQCSICGQQVMSCDCSILADDAVLVK